MKRKCLSNQNNLSENDGAIRPQLTSLIDVMTILLVFLIQNFSVEGNLITPSNDLTLPQSSVQNRPEMMVSVQVSEDAVMVDGEKVISISEFAESEDYMISALFDRMKIERGNTTEPKLMLEADRELPFNIIKRVAFTCNKAGFSDFSVLVYQEEA